MVPALQTIQQLYQEQLSLQGETDPLFSLNEKTDEKYTNEVQSETEDYQNTVPSKSVKLINDEDDISIDLNRTLSREDEKRYDLNFFLKARHLLFMPLHPHFESTSFTTFYRYSATIRKNIFSFLFLFNHGVKDNSYFHIYISRHGLKQGLAKSGL